MKYKGMELKKITTPQVFDPPRQMFVWDKDVNCNGPLVQTVYAVIRTLVGTTQAVGTGSSRWLHCAEIPEEPKPRRATNRELAKWLATGIGEYRNQIGLVTNAYTYDESESDMEVCTHFKVRKWEDTEWHEPTVAYMGIVIPLPWPKPSTNEMLDYEMNVVDMPKYLETHCAEIGNQIWMSENLFVTDGGDGIHWNKDNGEFYYTWEAAKRIADKIPGWHLPSRDEWNELLTVVKTNSLMQEGYWGSIFDVKPTGYWNETFISDSMTTNFWSYNIDDSDESRAWRIYMSKTPYSSWESRSKSLGFSVRLVKDR